MAFDPYAPPSSQVGSAPLSTGDVRRDGDVLVVDVDGGDSLPGICVKCGQPADGPRLTRKLQWHPRWVYFLLLFNVIFYGIGAFMTRKRMTVAIPLCDHHRGSRRNRMLGGVAGMAVAALAFVAGIVLGNDAGAAMAMVGGLVGLAGLILLVASLSPLQPVIISDFEGRFRGADAGFLDQLPSA